jgi:hypothetical protein
MWTVELFRIGSGCGYTHTARTRKAAYVGAKNKAGAAYLTGVSGSNGERYGVDITERLDDCFWRASKLIGGSKTCPRASATDEWKAATVEIRRV